MPTYEYACRDCGEHLEVVQSFKDDALTECPNCKGQLRKVFSAAGIIFKGSGWHIKDYASKGGGAATSSPGGSDPDSGSSREAKSSERTSGDKKSSDSKSSDPKSSDPKSSGDGSSAKRAPSSPSEKSA